MGKMQSLAFLPTELIAAIAADCETLADLHSLALTSHRLLAICLGTPSPALYTMFKASYPLNTTHRCPPQVLLLAVTKAEQLIGLASGSTWGPGRVEAAITSSDSWCLEILTLLPLTFEDLKEIQTFLRGDMMGACDRPRSLLTTSPLAKSALHFALMFYKAHHELFHLQGTSIDPDQLFMVSTTGRLHPPRDSVASSDLATVILFYDLYSLACRCRRQALGLMVFAGRESGLIEYVLLNSTCEVMLMRVDLRSDKLTVT